MLALALLAGCDDAQGEKLRTPEGRQACAERGGQVFDAPLGDGTRNRCWRMIDVTAPAVEDTTGGGR